MSWVYEVSGLTIGTAYWFDMQFAASGGGSALIQDIDGIVEEI